MDKQHSIARRACLYESVQLLCLWEQDTVEVAWNLVTQLSDEALCVLVLLLLK